MNSISDNGLTVTYQGTEDGLKMSDPNGESYEAKFDGKDYPVQGDPGHTMVSLKRIGNDTIEETDKRDGKMWAYQNDGLSRWKMDHCGVHQQAARNHHNLQDGKTVVSCRNRNFAIVERAGGRRSFGSLPRVFLSRDRIGDELPVSIRRLPHLNLDNDSLKSYHVWNSMHNDMIIKHL